MEGSSRAFTGGPRVAVGLDFGTTFSGFAYAHISQPSKVHTFYEWPEQASGGGQPYCKTQTSIYYSKHDNDVLKLESWGWPALVEYRKALTTLRSKHPRAPPVKVGEFVTKFKLQLASYGDGLSAEALPDKLTARMIITDYLREISRFIMKHLKNRFGEHFDMHEVQWCLTVPVIWDDHAKQLMKSYAEEAGLIQNANNANTDSSASPHPLLIMLEPEAAAIYCLHKMKSLSFEIHNKFLTADIGGGTVDIVIHEKLESGEDADLKLKEVACSTGDLCGGTYVDMHFIHHLSQRIGCLQSFLDENPSSLLSILRWWEAVKTTFNGTTSATLDIPSKLARAWEIHESEHKSAQKSDSKSRGWELCERKQQSTKMSDSEVDGKFDEVEFSAQDLMSIFDKVVDQIIDLIGKALRPFSKGEVKAIMAVGGFSGSPYLMKRLREEFAGIVGEIVSPPDPGSAVCQGAAMWGISKQDIIISRICRKTYGISISRDFEIGDPLGYKWFLDGEAQCGHVFFVFARIGDAIPVNHTVTHVFRPLWHFQRSMSFEIISSTKSDPKYTKAEDGAEEEGSFELDMSSGMELDKKRIVEVTMFFGRSSIEVTAKGKNFSASGKTECIIPVTYTRDFG